VTAQRVERRGQVAAHADLEHRVGMVGRERACQCLRWVDRPPDVEAQGRRRLSERRRERVVGGLEQLARRRHQPLATVGERRPRPVAIDEHAHPRLERCDAPGHRLLREVERVRRPSEVLVVGHGHEGAHLADVEVHGRGFSHNPPLSPTCDCCWTPHAVRGPLSSDHR
jgi:hypothetical protein